MLTTKADGYYFHSNVIQEDNKIQYYHSIPKLIKVIIQEYDVIFTMPKELPARRLVDYMIQLKPTTTPVHIIPYRYLHFQKLEIEKIVVELLNIE